MIKKLLLGIVIMCTLVTATYGDETANLRMNITGATTDNRYFLCVPNIGCLSIARADAGKIYPFYNDIRMRNIFLTNLQNFEVTGIGLPPSCDVTVKTGQTLSIYGHINSTKKVSYISGLYCSLK